MKPRAGVLRATVLAKRRKARLGDARIAQSCVDRGIPLLTRDRYFRTFAEGAGLDLILGSEAGKILKTLSQIVQIGVPGTRRLGVVLEWKSA